ncbi:hypothetical protein EYZ11_013078 [Aspergillus tanneri]|uniref:Uncharacterized protein n=1 Tax=Aspergillus tanneri TaxID=1220188 RepID=A0A4S3IYK1_9EURO|nr:hypothetical protein EYZ11_013078 [Aspergillus tanneri]
MVLPSLGVVVPENPDSFARSGDGLGETKTTGQPIPLANTAVYRILQTARDS